MMDTNAKLGPNALSGVEREFESANFSHMYIYVREGLENYMNDANELRRRRDIVRKYCSIYDDAYAYTAILSALVLDQSGWDEALRTGSNMIPASVGFVSYSYLKELKASEKDLKIWWQLIEFSAAKGHINAKIMVAWKTLRILGPLRYPVLAPYRLYLGVRVFLWIRNDPNDDRIPKALRKL